MILPTYLRINLVNSHRNSGSVGMLVRDNRSSKLGVIYCLHQHKRYCTDTNIPTDTELTISNYSRSITAPVKYARDGFSQSIDAAFAVFEDVSDINKLGFRADKLFIGISNANLGDPLTMFGIGSQGNLNFARVTNLHEQLEFPLLSNEKMIYNGVLLGPMSAEDRASAFCYPGDSGAIWYNDKFEAVGLHVAGYYAEAEHKIFPYMLKISVVLNALDVSIVTPDEFSNLVPTE
ncbi:hypothetical protein [Sessilibacter sp. MAH2]